MQLLLVRHGQTTSNVAMALDTGAPGAALTALGQRQAVERAAALAGLDVGAVFCSTLLRARQTAAPIAAEHGLEPVVRDGIREIGAGSMELRTDEQSRLTYRAVAFDWVVGTPSTMPDSTVTGTRFRDSYDAVVDEALAAAAGRTAVLVTHGSAMRVWAAMSAGNVGADFARDHPVPNTGTIALDRDGSGWRVVDWDGSADPR